MSLEAAREALAARAGAARRRRHHQPARDRRPLGPATLAPVAPAIVWQDRRTADRCRELRDAGDEPLLRERTGLVLDPYFSATKLEWLLRDPTLAPARRGGELAAGTIESWLVARLTGGRVHVSDPTNASRRSSTTSPTRDWDDELLRSSPCRARCCRSRGPSGGVVGETDPEHLGCRAADRRASRETSRPRSSARAASRPGMAKNTYGTGAFLLVHAGTSVPSPARGPARHRRLRRRRRAGLRARGQRVHRRRRDPVAARRARRHRHRGRDARRWRARPIPGGVHFVPAFVGLGTPHWEPEARGTITGLTRGTTRAHLVRAALESMAFGTRRPARGDGGRRALHGAAAPGGRRRRRQRLADAVPGRHARRAGRAAGDGRDDGAGCGRARGDRDRRLASVEEFAAAWRFARFEPAMGRADRERKLAEWRRAIGAALAWARG